MKQLTLIFIIVAAFVALVLVLSSVFIVNETESHRNSRYSHKVPIH
jgi:regulator of protease activity HflC (stomatin/prohibitin superfamily)